MSEHALNLRMLEWIFSPTECERLLQDATFRAALAGAENAGDSGRLLVLAVGLLGPGLNRCRSARASAARENLA